MVGSFGFTHTPDVIFGIGSRVQLRNQLSVFGRNIIVVTGKESFQKSRFSSELMNDLSSARLNITHVQISGEPGPDDINLVIKASERKAMDCVVAIGGGSVMDAGKAISAMLPLGGNVKDYLEGVGKFEHPGFKVPFIAMPTTSGTGSEATKNAVITEFGKLGFKKSLRHNNFVPNLAIIDPELMSTCPSEITAAGGMDAFTQLVESYLSTKSTPFTDAMALNGIEHLICSIELAVFEGHNLEAREGMAYAAFLSGITLANAGLGVIHGFAQPLGSLFRIPHGVVCGTLMAAANKVTLDQLLSVKKDSIALLKYARLGELVAKKSGRTTEMAQIFIEYVSQLTDKLSLPKIGKYGVKQDDIDAIVVVTELKNHPVKLQKQSLEEILLERL